MYSLHLLIQPSQSYEQLVLCSLETYGICACKGRLMLIVWHPKLTSLAPIRYSNLFKTPEGCTISFRRRVD
jgi:hypothetical protein